jgi:hypothetical protein
LPPMLPLHLPPSVFSIHVALQIATAIDCHCHCFCSQSCHLSCHQIWAPNRALFLIFR